MIEKTMYQLSYCEVWDDYWYHGPVYENESDALAAGKTLDEEEYNWAVDPIVVYLRNTLVTFMPSVETAFTEVEQGKNVVDLEY